MPLSTSKLLLANGVARGDVAFGALARFIARPVIRGVGAVGRKLLGAPAPRKLLTGKVIPGIAGAISLPAVQAGRTALLKRAAKSAAGVAAGAAGTLALERAVTGQLIGAGVRRRRMNPANFRALGRATRRLAGFHRLAMKAESSLRKFAPRARGRRCPPVRKPCR